MRKFQFSLQAALGMRERAVEAAERAMQIVQEQWNGNQQRQRDLIDEVHEAEASVESGPIDSEDFVALDRFRSGAMRRRMRLAQEALNIASALELRRAEWQKAERDRTLLTRMREKAKAKWVVEYDREQQQLAEEVYVSRWNAQ